MAGNKDSDILLKFIGFFPDYLSSLSRTLLRFFGQPLSKQLYIWANFPEGGYIKHILRLATLKESVVNTISVMVHHKKVRSENTMEEKEGLFFGIRHDIDICMKWNTTCDPIKKKGVTFASFSFARPRTSGNMKLFDPSLGLWLYKSFHCHISLKLWQNTAKFVKRIVASKFSKRN